MNKNKNILLGLLALLTYFILSIFSSTIISILPIDINSLSTDGKFIANILYELFIIIIILLILKETVVNDFNIYKKNIKAYYTEYIKYWFLALGLMFISNFLILLFFTNDIANNEQAVRQLFDANPFLTFILASILAPVLEELVFRLSIYKIIGNHKTLFIIISGLIFGLMHVLGNANTFAEWLYIIPYSIPGCVFAYTLTKSNNIFVPISLHLTHNTFALILQLLATLLK